jgi:hypothetical protein
MRVEIGGTNMRPDFQIRTLRLMILSLLLSVGVMGASYALYTERTEIRSSLAMGGIDVVFTEVTPEDAGTSTQAAAAADIAGGGRSIVITLDGARPGDVFCFTYRLQNNGTVPVFCEPADGGGSGLLTVYPESDRLEAGGGTGTGLIRVRIGDDMAP